MKNKVMGENRRLLARIKRLEAELAKKDRIIADLVKRHLESREHELEQRVAALEQALEKWIKAALKGKVEVVAKPHLTTRSTRTRRKRRAG